MSRRSIMLLIALMVVIVIAGPSAYYMYRPNAPRIGKFRQWMRNPASHPDWKLVTGSQKGGSVIKKTRWLILASMLAFGLASCSSTPRRNETRNEGIPDNQGIPDIAPEGRMTEEAARNEADPSLPVMTADSPPILLTPVQGDATPPSERNVPASEDWQTFTSTVLGVAVDYPVDWSVAEERAGAIFTSPQGTTIALQAANAVHDNNETRVGNQRCTSRTNPYGLTADICVGNSSFLYTATFPLQSEDGSTRWLTLLTRTRTAGDVFEGMFNSLRLVK